MLHLHTICSKLMRNYYCTFRYAELRRRIVSRMESLKVHL